LVSLSNIANANPGDIDGQGTILDTTAPVVASVADASIDEGDSGNSTLNFVVQLSRVSQNDVVVQYQTADNSAQAGSDYIAVSDTLVIPAGQTQASIPVIVLGDQQFEQDEQLQLVLSAAQNANLANNQATGVIRNDDVATTDLALTLDSVPNIGSVNQPVTWTFTASHLNGEAATDVALRAIIVGTGLTFNVPANCTQNNVASNRTTITCQLNDLAPNQSITTDIQVTSNAIQGLYLLAKLSNQPTDINKRNNIVFNSLTITSSRFNNPRSRIGGFACRDVSSGDINNDGAVDLIAATGSPTQIFFNDGAGGFNNTPLTLADNPESYGVAVADFNQDGQLDFALANDGANQIYLNQGVSTADSMFQISSLPRANNSRDVVAVDIDQDNDIDLVFANLAAADTIWLNNGAGQFTHFADLSSADSVEVAAADLNGDNAPELLFAQPLVSQSLWLNNGTGVMTLSNQTTGPATAVALGDLNKDTQIDAVIANAIQNTDADNLDDVIVPQITVLHNSNGQLNPVQTFASADISDIELADFNTDGQLDLLLETTTAANNLYVGVAGGQFDTLSTTLESNGVAAHTVDLDNNSQPDIVFALGDDIGLNLFYNNSAEFGQQRIQANIQRGSGSVGWLTVSLMLMMLLFVHRQSRHYPGARQSLFGIVGLVIMLGVLPKAHADTASNWSIGLLGQAFTSHAKGSDLNYDLLVQNGHQNVQADVDKEQLAGELFIHYRFNNSPFGVELNLFDSGEYQSSISAETDRPAQLLEDFAAVHPRSGRGVGLGARGDAEIGRGFGAHIKLGLAYWRGKFELQSNQMQREFTDSGTMFIFRSGINYQLTPSWSLASTIGLENYPDHNIYHIDLGVIWTIPGSE